MTLPTLRAMLTVVCAPLLGACTVAQPWRDLSGPPTAADPPTRVVALTHAVLDPATRRPFDRGSALVIDTLASQPGIVGYAVRQELFGNQVWTMTAWRDEAARAAFVRSDVHRAAMRDGSLAILRGRFAHVELPAGEVPISWTRALAILESDAVNY